MSKVTQGARISNKIIAVTGSVPTLPLTNDHTDGTWSTTDIYPAEIAINIIDDKVYTRTANSILLLNSFKSGTYSNISFANNLDLNKNAIDYPNYYTDGTLYNITNGASNIYGATATSNNIVNGYDNIIGTFSGYNTNNNIINGYYNTIAQNDQVFFTYINGSYNILDNNVYGVNINGSYNGVTQSNIININGNTNTIIDSSNINILGNNSIINNKNNNNILSFNPIDGSTVNYKGDNRSGKAGAVIETSNATPKNIYFDGFSVSPNSYKIETDSAYYMRLSIIAADSSGNIKQFKGEGAIKNVAGTTSLVGSFTISSSFADTAMSACTVSVTANNTTDALDITCTGIAATHIQWVATLDFEKVSF